VKDIYISYNLCYWFHSRATFISNKMMHQHTMHAL